MRAVFSTVAKDNSTVAFCNSTVAFTTVQAIFTTVDFCQNVRLNDLNAVCNGTTVELSTQRGCVCQKNAKSAFKAFKGGLYINLYTHPTYTKDATVVPL